MGERLPEMREWAEAEERLYPVVTVRPDLYEVCAALVRSLADHLSSVPDVDALAATWRAADFEQDASAAGIEQASIPPDVDRRLVRGAAYAIREREIVVDGRASGARRAIERARTEGRTTAIVWSEGENELWPPYRRVEMSLISGRAVSRSTELDPDTMVSRFFLTAFQLDPTTGESIHEEPLVPERSFIHPDEWRSAAATLRAELFEADEKGTSWVYPRE